MFRGWISTKEIVSLQELIAQISSDVSIGAITSFTGIVRQISDNTRKNVKWLEIEAWEERADDELSSIAKRIGEKYDLLDVIIVHIVGKLEIGDPIVYVVLSSVHRKEAFAALEETIQAYKNESPVWKKEIYEDGTSKWISTTNNS